VIVITGPGRSGTSFLASIATRLGYDVGGGWDEAMNAGLEALEIVALNDAIIFDLGMTPTGAPTGTLGRLHRTARRVMPTPLRRRLQRPVAALPGVRTGAPGMLRWEHFDAVVARHRAAMLDLAARHPIVKDPRFSWTLAAWAAAGVRFEHVLVTVRSVDAIGTSLARVARATDTLSNSNAWFRSSSASKNSIIYSIGLCVSALYAYRIPHRIVRFPDLLDDPEGLYEAMRFPGPVSREDFLRVFAEVRRPDLVHDSR
jgi:hypothetical protein